ncbi:hypothetical protein DBR06_SOUSAS17710038, partial [Sousa chinensis]
HLKETLKLMNVGENLVKEDIDDYRYEYLDGFGVISSVGESVTE